MRGERKRAESRVRSKIGVRIFLSAIFLSAALLVRIAPSHLQ